MSDRPDLDTGPDGNTFNYYYLREELVDFCRKNNMEGRARGFFVALLLYFSCYTNKRKCG